MKSIDFETGFNLEVIAEAKLLCKAHCRAVNCDNGCRNIWPGPGGFLDIYFAEARKRVWIRVFDVA